MAMPLPVSYRRIKALLDAENFDVLHIQVPYSPLMAGKIIKAADPRTVVIGTFHILPHSPLVVAANHLLGLWSRPTIKRFDIMTATSPPTAQFARKTFKIDCKVVPLPVELDKFSGAKPFAEYKDGLNVLFLGRLVERKGCQYLLKAVALAVKNGSWPQKAHVTICGFGPLEAKLKNYAKDHGLQDVVEFKGFISEADKPRFLAGADVVVYPSTGGESFGIVLLEAMAASRGVVLAGNNPGYASVMAPRPDSLFNPIATKQLADLLVESLSSPALRKQANDWQKQYIKNFDLPKVGKQTVELYGQALNSR
jgi:phosphatidylinositol alpha-mannosyltransferase